jgi:hypothetical protein
MTEDRSQMTGARREEGGQLWPPETIDR